MSYAELHRLLDLIEQWVEVLEDDRLSEQCRQSGIDFFNYMEKRGVPRGVIAKIIRKCTGKEPRTMWKVKDVTFLRDAIRRYESAIVTARHDKSTTPIQHIKHHWS